MTKLTIFQRQTYASGAFTKSMLWNFTDLLLLYYLADIQGLGAASAGFILLISLVISGILDITLSLLLDKFNLHYQKVIAFGAPLTALSFAVLFYPLPAAADYLFAYYFVVTILFRIGYALVDIPHNAMLGTLTRDTHERTSLSSSRIFFNSCAILCFAIYAGDVLTLLESENISLRIGILVACSTFMLVNLYLCVLPVWRTGRLPENTERISTKHAFAALLRNRAFLVLAAFSLVPCIFIPVFYKSGVYFASLILLDEKFTTWLITSLALGKLVSLPLYKYLSKSMEKHHLMICSMAGLALVFLLFALFNPDTLVQLCTYFLICGFFSGGFVMILWSALPDTIEYGAAQGGTSNQALTFGAFHLVTRVSDGLCFAIIAFVLEYSQSTASNSNTELFADLTALIAFAGCLLGAVVLWFYPLTRAVHNALATEKDK
ncbi:MFS transporter [Alteromonas sp. 1_MG-2023]|uniref:MFS transporter n=1 Tax=Alteromonas sp. 1_MG-2023 TaxID=3062669 RepID=UPI0026E40CFD|nr:MFS transporter [Alteromonas sp. 1_MG-2023]MDO6474317.1 MFS transporter [Alteromonas sp. 1_MG-2023]